MPVGKFSGGQNCKKLNWRIYWRPRPSLGSNGHWLAIFQLFSYWRLRPSQNYDESACVDHFAAAMAASKWCPLFF
jgi:hypothetical protein